MCGSWTRDGYLHLFVVRISCQDQPIIPLEQLWVIRQCKNITMVTMVPYGQTVLLGLTDFRQAYFTRRQVVKLAWVLRIYVISIMYYTLLLGFIYVLYHVKKNFAIERTFGNNGQALPPISPLNQGFTVLLTCSWCWACNWAMEAVSFTTSFVEGSMRAWMGERLRQPVIRWNFSHIEERSEWAFKEFT